MNSTNMPKSAIGNCMLGECDWTDELTDTGYTEIVFDWGSWIVIVLALLAFALTPTFFAFFYRRKGNNFDLRAEMTDKDNKAFAVALAGFLAGFAAILRGSIADFGESAYGEWGGARKQTSDAGIEVRADNLLSALIGIVTGLVLLLISVHVDRVFLTRTIDDAQGVLDGNLACGIVEAAHFLSSGLSISGPLTGWVYAGWSDGFASIFILFAFSQLMFLLCAEVFQRSTHFDIWKHVAEDNPAVAIAYAGQLVAIGNLVQGATSVTYEVPALAFVVSVGTAVLVISRWLFDVTVFPGEKFDKEISEDKNWGLAVLVAATQVALSEALGNFMVNPCIANETIKDLQAKDLGDKLFGTTHVDKLLTADRAYAIAVLLLVIIVSRLAFCVPFILRRYSAGVSTKSLTAAPPVAAANIEEAIERELDPSDAGTAKPKVSPTTSEAEVLSEDEARPGARTQNSGLLMQYSKFDLDHELVQKDNAALSLTFGGYMASLGLILAGNMTALSDGTATTAEMGTTALYTVIWAFIGMALMLVAHFINDFILMRNFSNVQAIVSGQNVAAGIAEAGSYLAAALVIAQIVAGADRSDESERWEEFASVMLWFSLSSILLIVYVSVFNCLELSYDQQAEITDKNAAAGIYFATHLVAVGLIISKAVGTTDSLPTFFVWSVFGTIITAAARYFLKPRVLNLDAAKQQTLYSEIKEDRNWGAALVVGVLAISIALICNTALRECPYTCAANPCNA